jgi:RHS repeat-associated protein
MPLMKSIHIADVDYSGTMNATDAAAVQSNYGHSVGTVGPLYDIDGNGAINATDSGLVSAAYGSAIGTARVSSVGNPYLFTDRRMHFFETDFTGLGPEPNTPIQYNRARHYDPQHGRWLQRDPLEYTDSFNLYEAFKSSPGVWTDPYGQKNWQAYLRDKKEHGWAYAGFWDWMGAYDVTPEGDDYEALIAELNNKQQLIKRLGTGIGGTIEFLGAFNDGADFAIVVNEWLDGDVHISQFATLLPFIGRGHLTVLNKCGKILKRYPGKAVDVLATIKPARELKRVLRGVGKGDKEVHHLIEMRFARRLQIPNGDDIEAALIEQLVHRGIGPKSITNALRKEIPYRHGGDYRDVSYQDIYDAHKRVYTDLGIPEIMEVVNHWFVRLGVVIDKPPAP